MMNLNDHTPNTMAVINQKLIVCGYSRFVLMPLDVVNVIKIVGSSPAVFQDRAAPVAHLIAVEWSVGNELPKIGI